MNYSYSDSVYEEAERKANIFNLIFSGALIILEIIVLVLELLEVFIIPNEILIPVLSICFVLFLAPLVVYFVHDKLLKKNISILSWKKFKYVIYVPVYFGLLIIDIVLSFHAVLLIVVPPLMAAQYRFIRRDWTLILITTVITIPLIMYGSYIFGIPDKNLLKELTSSDDPYDISVRLSYLTPSRAVSVFLHHCLPRIFAIAAIDFLIAAIVGRNNEMLDKQAKLAKEVNDVAQKQNKLQEAVIDELASVIETRDIGTGEHVKRTKKYVEIICHALAKEDKYKNILTPIEINKIVAAAPLHDIGKIVVSDTILLKPGRLTNDEFEKMKKHAKKGGEMVEAFFNNFDDKAFYEEAVSIAMHHHEKWNGEGYPDGLKEEQIPLAARIMAIADVYDALVSKRVYKEPMDKEEAFDLIVKEAGKHFDPDIIKALIKAKEEFIEASI